MLSLRRGKKKSEAIKEGLALRRAQGKPTGQPPYGYKIRYLKRGRRGKKTLVRDDHERAVGTKLVEWRDKGFTFEAIWRWLREQRVRAKNGREWSLMRIHRAYDSERRLQATEAARAAASSGEQPAAE